MARQNHQFHRQIKKGFLGAKQGSGHGADGHPGGQEATIRGGPGGKENFTSHDLRPTAINNWRLQGNDYFRIMAATGHQTMTVFKRYNTVRKEELMALVEENR